MGATFDAKKITSTLKDMETNVARKFTRQALREGAKVQQSSAVAGAPDKSGATKSSIKVRALKRTTGKIGVLVSISISNFSGRNWYPTFVEFGHKSKHGKKTPGTHWFRNRFKQTVAAARQRIIAKFTELISKYKGETVGPQE